MVLRLAKDAANLALNLLAVFARGLKKLRLIGSDDGLSTLLLPPAATGNLGDDAMVSATLEFLRRSGAKRLGVIAFGTRNEWSEWLPETEIVDVGVSRWLWVKVKFVFAVMRFERFYCLGADMMDGYYIANGPNRIAELASLASAAGVRPSILGFSFNDRPTQDAVRALQNLPRDVRLCVRDPISYERLAAHLERSIELVADVAFVLEPSGGTGLVVAVHRWIEKEKTGSRIVVGVNLNHRLFVGSGTEALDEVMGRLRRALVGLFDARKGLSFLLIPHDYRPYKGYPGDVEVAEALLAILPAEVRSHALVVGKCRASEIRAVCGHLDFVVTGLMHLAIAALERGTPAACLSYQGKFEGLMSHLGISGLIADPEEALDGLRDFALPLIEEREELRNKLMSRLPRIRKLALANFA